MTPDLKGLLMNVPEKDVLNSINPFFSERFGILPVDIRYLDDSQPILDVIGLKGVEKIDETFGWKFFRKIVNYVGEVDKTKWEEAYNLFYRDFLKN